MSNLITMYQVREWVGNEYSKTLGTKLRVASQAKKLIKRLRSRGRIVFLSKVMVCARRGT